MRFGFGGIKKNKITNKFWNYKLSSSDMSLLSFITGADVMGLDLRFYGAWHLKFSLLFLCERGQFHAFKCVCEHFICSSLL